MECEASDSPLPCEGEIKYRINPYSSHTSLEYYSLLCERHQFGWPIPKASDKVKT